MRDLTREQCFCQWVISKILALYMTQEDFRNEVDSKVNDGYSFSIGGEKMSEYEQAEWKLNMVCVDIAKQFTEYYFKDFWGDEFEADRKTEPQRECNPTCKFYDERCLNVECYDCCDGYSRYKPKTEPTISKMEQVEDEPQTELVNDSPILVKDLVDDEFNPYDEECMRCKHLKLKCEFIPTYCKFESRDEPQTDCAWR